MKKVYDNKAQKESVFCVECRKDVEISIVPVEKSRRIKGVDVKYIAKEAYCKECESEIFISKLNDENLDLLDKAYREAKDIITVGEIENILRNYNIGKRPLSLILGWGETTLTRFLDGDIPSKSYSNTLKRISSDREYLGELLETNKHKISNKAYSKIYQELYTIKDCESLSKIESVANYIIKNSVDITPLALQKLLYFSQSFYEVFFERFMFEEDCQAWVHGPVYKDIYFKYKKHGYNPIEENLDKFNCFNLIDSEIKIIDSILDNFGCYSGRILERMTHEERPWTVTRNGLKPDERSEKKIEKGLIKEYFRGVYEKFNMQNPADIKDYSSDLFVKIR